MAYELKNAFHRKILQAALAGQSAAIEKAKLTNTPLVIWHNGKMKKISADGIARARGKKVAVCAKIFKTKSSKKAEK